MKISTFRLPQPSTGKACRGRFCKKWVNLAVLCGCFLAGLAVRAGDSHPFVKGELIVAFRAEVDKQRQEDVENNHGDQTLKKFDGLNARHLKIGNNRSVERAIQEYQGETNVLYVQPNYIYHAVEIIPNDAWFGQLWGLKNTGQNINGKMGTAGADIQATLAWDLTQGSRTVVVGVVDTGIDYTHPDLAANVWSNPGGNVPGTPGSHGYNAITGTYNPMDNNGHGTHVSGTIGAVGNNIVGVVGVNWTTSIMGLKFLDASGHGTTANAISAIDFAVQAKLAGVNVRVLNASWGGGGPDPALRAEIAIANANDILFVAAAGNGDDYGNPINIDNSPFYPASYGLDPSTPNVIAVAATDNNDMLASWSDYGFYSVHLGAPGVDVTSTWPGNQYYVASGTSMATPHVTGSAALIVARAYLPVADLKATILQNVDPIPSLTGKTVTGGRLNVFRAVQAGAPTPDFSLTVSPASATVAATGGAVGYTVTINRTTGFADSVTLAVSGLPEKAIGIFSNPNPTTGDSSTLTVTVDQSVAAGSYPFTVTGTASTLIHAATATFVKLDLTENIFGTATPSMQWAGNQPYEYGTKFRSSVKGTITKVRLCAGPSESGTHTVRIWQNDNGTLLAGPYDWTPVANWSWQELPLSPALSIVADKDYTVSVSTGTDATHYVAYITGYFNNAGNNGSHLSWLSGAGVYTTVPGTMPTVIGGGNAGYMRDVGFLPDRDFSLSATPSSRTVTAGSGASYSIGMTPSGGFSGAVTLGVSGLPTGASGSFSQNPISSGSSTLSVTTSGTTPAGSYPLTITGTSGSLTHTVKATLVVQASPVAPSNLAAQAMSKTQINLSWADNSNNETGFKIERSKDNNAFSQIATVGANVTKYSNTGLTRNTTYYYRVRAYNGTGNSAYSNTAIAKTLN